MATADSEKEKLSIMWGLFILVFISVCYLHAMHYSCQKKLDGMHDDDNNPQWADSRYKDDNRSDLGWRFTSGSQLRFMQQRDDPQSNSVAYDGLYDLLPYSAFMSKDSFLSTNSPPMLWDPLSFGLASSDVVKKTKK